MDLKIIYLMTILGLGKINKEFLIPISGGLIRAIFNITMNYVSKANNQINKLDTFIKGVCTELGMILSFTSSSIT